MINQHSALVREASDLFADKEARVATVDLQKNMAMRVRVPNQGSAHVQQRHAAEFANLILSASDIARLYRQSRGVR